MDKEDEDYPLEESKLPFHCGNRESIFIGGDDVPNKQPFVPSIVGVGSGVQVRTPLLWSLPTVFLLLILSYSNLKSLFLFDTNLIEKFLNSKVSNLLAGKIPILRSLFPRTAVSASLGATPIMITIKLYRARASSQSRAAS